jgi:hypothetical protein
MPLYRQLGLVSNLSTSDWSTSCLNLPKVVCNNSQLLNILYLIPRHASLKKEPLGVIKYRILLISTVFYVF